MKKVINCIQDEESGQGMVEYSLIMSLVVLAVIVAITTLGLTVDDLFSKSIAKIESAVE